MLLTNATAIKKQKQKKYSFSLAAFKRLLEFGAIRQVCGAFASAGWAVLCQPLHVLSPYVCPSPACRALLHAHPAPALFLGGLPASDTGVCRPQGRKLKCLGANPAPPPAVGWKPSCGSGGRGSEAQLAHQGPTGSGALSALA